MVVHQLVAQINAHYGYKINKVFIKNSRSRWGSCSERGNLNFNYRIVFLPPHLQHYLVVHELCHLGELNHSPKFWARVAETFPAYKSAKKELQKFRLR